MNMEVLSINRKGVNHSRLEDAIYKNNEDFVYGVFDGVSSARYGAQAANTLAEDMGRCFHNSDFRKSILTLPVQEVRNKLVEVIQLSAKKVQEKYKCEIKEASCTLVMCVLDPDTKTATILHCGDGAVFAVSDTYPNATASIISHPDNSQSGAVYPAQAANQIARMRVIRVSIETLRGLIICTDGFSSAYFNPMQAIFDSFRLPLVLNCKSSSELEALVDEVHINECSVGDDISAIVLKFDHQIDYSGLGNEVRQIASLQKNNNEIFADNTKESSGDTDAPEKLTEVNKIPESEPSRDSEVGVNNSDINAKENLSDKGENTQEQLSSDYPDKAECTEKQDEDSKSENGSGAVKVNHFITALLAIVVALSLCFAFVKLSGYQKEKAEREKSISELQSSISQLSAEKEKILSRLEKLENKADKKEETTTASNETVSENIGEEYSNADAESTVNDTGESTASNEDEG